MSVAKLKASGTPDVMKSEDRIDTIIRQAIGKESFLSFPRASDSPMQWIQLLHALDQQGVTCSNIYIFGGSFSKSFCLCQFLYIEC